ncbi:hypothetical protein PMAYCL1PPCAC_20192, partial [Pristionchus mayeri]
MKSVALVVFLANAASAVIREFEADFPQPEDLFLYTIERTRREVADSDFTHNARVDCVLACTAQHTMCFQEASSTTTTTPAPVITATTTALPTTVSTTLAPITVTPSALVSFPASTALNIPSGLQLNRLGWAGQPYRYEPLGLQRFPTGGYRFTHVLVAPGAPSALASNYAP